MISRAESPERTERLLADTARLTGTPCASCGDPVCPHEAVMSLASGFKTSPRCARCLAVEVEQEPAAMIAHLSAHFTRRDCWGAAWQAAGEAEHQAPGEDPPCLRTPDAAWDGGDMSCGDLVLELRLRVRALAPRQVLRLVARDPGAPHDLPAWCGLTGHRLLRATHPVYLIERKES